MIPECSHLSSMSLQRLFFTKKKYQISSVFPACTDSVFSIDSQAASLPIFFGSFQSYYLNLLISDIAQFNFKETDCSCKTGDVANF